ncbi:MAG: putative Ig domain protein [Syntrophorhabdus sp. PtaU1.Bin153]|nr:MAG: putative Ig domain protein [Syntrophorhabdus sp. PtaU1.Bin153]
MPIEIILPDDPVEVRGREEPKGPQNKSNFVLVCFGVVVLVLIMVYFGYRKNTRPLAVEPSRTETVDIGSMSSGLSGDDTSIAKKLIFSRGISNAKLVFDTIDGKNCLKIVAQDVKNVPGITWAFEWTKNGQPFGSGDTITGFRRGEILTVKITPYDGEKYGTSKILRTEIKNTVPEVTVEKGTAIEGDNLSYQVKAVDPDGDPLTYSLADAPSGMAVDAKTGVITWQVPAQDQGSYTVKVKIADGQGGESIYPLNIDLAKPTIK